MRTKLVATVVVIAAACRDDSLEPSRSTDKPNQTLAVASTTTFTWARRFPADSPKARDSHAMAYDAARHQVVLFGGSTPGVGLNDTWVWDGTSWTQKFPTTSPQADAHFGLAYDAARAQVVLFGGANPFPLAETWVWDGTNWTQKTPAQSPPARNVTAMAYDGARTQVVLFGGTDPGASPGVVVNDTWVWDGSTWTEKTPASPAPSPPGRVHHTMAYDPVRQQVVLFGGDNGSAFYGDTWVWNGTAWQDKTPSDPAKSPPPLTAAAIAYDAALERVILFGGVDASNVYRNDTYAWDGSAWEKLSPAGKPSPRADFGLAYDEARNQLVLFGGSEGAPQTPNPPIVRRGDTWIGTSECSLQAVADAQLDGLTGGYIPKDQQSSARFPPLVILDARGTQSLGCGTVTYTWQWTQNDGSPQTSSGQYVPAKIDPGTRIVTLEVTNTDGTKRSTAEVDVHVPDLVVLVHGFMGSERSFGQLGTKLYEADGSTVMPFDYTRYTSCLTTGQTLPIPELGDSFGTWLQAKVLAPGGPGYRGHIDVVTHSMGGLVVRTWMAGLKSSPEGPQFTPVAPAYVGGTFRRLITLGTPHYGADQEISALSGLCTFFQIFNSSVQRAQIRPTSEFLWRLQREWFRTSPMPHTVMLTVAGVVPLIDGDKVVPGYGAVFPQDAAVRTAYEECAHLPFVTWGGCALADVEDTDHPSFQIIRAFRAGALGTVPVAFVLPPHELGSGLALIRFETDDKTGFDFCDYRRLRGETCNPVRLTDANTGTRYACNPASILDLPVNCDFDVVDRGWGVLVIRRVPPGSYVVKILPDYRGLWTPAKGKGPITVTAGRPTVVRCDFLAKIQPTQSGPCVNATPQPIVLASP